MKTYFKSKRVLRMDKDFSEVTRDLFVWNHQCWICGTNRQDSLHHIMNGDFDEADSPFNAAPICNFRCHIGKSFTEEQKSMMLKKTLKYLIKQGYKFTEKDNKFLEKFKQYYDTNNKIGE